MISHSSAPIDYGFGKGRSCFGLLETSRVRFAVDKFKWIDRNHFRIKLFVLTIVEQHCESLTSSDAKVMSAVAAHLKAALELTFEEMRLTTIALNEDIFLLHNALFRRNGFYSFGFLIKPGHVERKRVSQ